MIRTSALRSASALLLAPVMLLGCPPPSGSSGGYLQQFETAASVDTLQRQVWHRNLSPNSGGLDFPGGHNFRGSWSGDHNMACEGPTTQRTVHASADGRDPEAFWWCAPKGPESGHFMTSMGDIDGYSIVAFAPNRSFSNFSRVCWDVNLTYLGQRKWPEVTIVSEADYQRTGRSLAWHLAEANRYTGSTVAWLQNDGVARGHVNGVGLNFDGSQYRSNDKATRVHHCLIDNRNGTITFRQERPDRLIQSTVPGRFPSDGRVIFSDHSYSPEKDGAPQGFTWHWDNLEVS